MNEKQIAENRGNVCVGMKTMKEFLGLLGSTIAEADVKINAGDIFLKAQHMDCAQISLIYAQAQVSGSPYIHGEAGEFYIDVEALKTALETDESAEVCITWDGIHVQIKTGTQTIDYDKEPGTCDKTNLPVVESKTSGRAASEDVLKTLKTIKKLKAGHVRVIWDKEKNIYLESHTDNNSAAIKTRQKIGYVDTGEDEGNVVYPLGYILDLVKSIPKKTTIRFCLQQDRPLKMLWSSGNVGGTYWLAPRLEYKPAVQEEPKAIEVKV